MAVIAVIREADAPARPYEGEALGTLELELCSTRPGAVERLFDKVNEFVAEIGQFHDDDRILEERFDGMFTHGDMRDLRNILMDVHRTLWTTRLFQEKEATKKAKGLKLVKPPRTAKTRERGAA